VVLDTVSKYKNNIPWNFDLALENVEGTGGVIYAMQKAKIRAKQHSFPSLDLI